MSRMMVSSTPFLNADALLRIARLGNTGAPCSHCAALVCPGWESVPGGFERATLQRIGTLRRPGDEEPTLEEHHPEGTRTGSANAPVAPPCFPYNRCDVWHCIACQRAFLRYTEYGGYYEDERIRALNAALVVVA